MIRIFWTNNHEDQLIQFLGYNPKTIRHPTTPSNTAGAGMMAPIDPFGGAGVTGTWDGSIDTLPPASTEEKGTEKEAATGSRRRARGRPPRGSWPRARWTATFRTR